MYCVYMNSFNRSGNRFGPIIEVVDTLEEVNLFVLDSLLTLKKLYGKYSHDIRLDCLTVYAVSEEDIKFREYYPRPGERKYCLELREQDTFTHKPLRVHYATPVESMGEYLILVKLGGVRSPRYQMNILYGWEILEDKHLNNYIKGYNDVLVNIYYLTGEYHKAWSPHEMFDIDGFLKEWDITNYIIVDNKLETCYNDLC